MPKAARPTAFMVRAGDHHGHDAAQEEAITVLAWMRSMVWSPTLSV